MGNPPGHYSSGHLAWQVRRDVPGVDQLRSIWIDSGHTLEAVARQLCDTRLESSTSVPVIDNVQQPDAGITQTPLVWSMLQEIDELASVEWLLNSYLWGELASLKLLQTGEAVPLEQDETYSASIRLETLIKVTQQRRLNYVWNPNDILPEDTVTRLLNDWKKDYTSWMNKSSQRIWCGLRKDERREWTRKRFRVFFFKMCGNYDLVRFWLRVPASGMSLRIFKDVFVDGHGSSDIKMQKAVQAVRYALRNADR